MAISDSFSGGPVASGRKLPKEVKTVLSAAMPELPYVDLETRGLQPGLVLLFGPMTLTDKGAYAIEAGFLCGSLCGSGTVYYFVWDGSAWIEATAFEAGEEYETMWAS